MLIIFRFFISHIASTHPWLVQRAQLDKAESQLVQHRARQEQYSQKVSILLQNKQEALQEISSLRTQQLQQSLENLSSQITSEFQQQQAQERAKVQAECEELWNTVPEEEEEPPTKRIKLDDGSIAGNDAMEEVAVETSTSQQVDESTSSSVAAVAEQEEPKPSELKKKQLEVLHRCYCYFQCVIVRFVVGFLRLDSNL